LLTFIFRHWSIRHSPLSTKWTLVMDPISSQNMVSSGSNCFSLPYRQASTIYRNALFINAAEVLILDC